MTAPNTITRTEYIDSNSNDTNKQVISHNADDNKIQESFYNDADGTLISKINYSYNNESGALQKVITTNADGDKIRTEEDTNDDGTLETVYTYDDDGNIDHMIEKGGEYDDLSRETYDDAAENVTRSTTVETDYNSRRITFDYDSHTPNRVVEAYRQRMEHSEAVTAQYDHDGNGNVDRTKTAIYSRSYNLDSEMDARLVESKGKGDKGKDDKGKGGKDNHRKGEDYDNEGMYGPGNPEIVMYNHNLNDDTLDRVVEYEYDEAGNVIKEFHYFNEATSDWNSSDDSEIVVQPNSPANQVFTYDAKGNLLSETYEVEADGVLNEYTTYEYVESKDRLNKTGAVNELTRQKRVLNNAHNDSGDGITDHFLSYQYHENGEVRQQVEAHDYDNDSRMDETYISTYDKAGNTIVYTKDKTGDGQTNYIETYIYDANNKYLTETYDHNGDGTVDEYYIL